MACYSFILGTSELCDNNYSPDFWLLLLSPKNNLCDGSARPFSFIFLLVFDLSFSLWFIWRLCIFLSSSSIPRCDFLSATPTTLNRCGFVGEKCTYICLFEYSLKVPFSCSLALGLYQIFLSMGFLGKNIRVAISSSRHFWIQGQNLVSRVWQQGGFLPPEATRHCTLRICKSYLTIFVSCLKFTWIVVPISKTVVWWVAPVLWAALPESLSCHRNRKLACCLSWRINGLVSAERSI